MTFPCYNSIAADRYADEQGDLDDLECAASARVDEMSTWTVEQLDAVLSSADSELLSEMLLRAAYTAIEREKRDASLIRWENSQ
jgi:hypothetical protein